MATAETGLPISPASMAARAVWMPVPSTVSGAAPTHEAPAAAMTPRASSKVAASGFSP